ncbi:MAG TPA: lytic transglycosylase domain-containing protein, partial [Longimicrobium sp.]|nr:lytic transglycosylase domain-containing protein [Longimicrobium sp.]
ALWDIPVVRNEPVDRFVHIFTSRRSEDMALYLKRSGRYEGMIRSKLRKAGMPEDLVYLTMIESGFNPNARSHANAVGLWQFMSSTGRGYGLRIDGYVDERRDPEKSTDAALRYLRDLHNELGSWYLAAAAYNGGGGRVSRALRAETGRTRGRGDADFWRIRHRIPRETREYVPLMVAAAVVGKEPEKYGLGHVERWMPLKTDTVSVPGGIPLATVARAAGVTEREVTRLNPHLVRKMTPPGKKDFPVRIPQGRQQQFTGAFPALHAEVVRVAAAERVRAAEVARQKAVERRAEARRAEARRVEARRAEARRAASRRSASRAAAARRSASRAAASRRSASRGTTTRRSRATSTRRSTVRRGTRRSTASSQTRRSTVRRPVARKTRRSRS